MNSKLLPALLAILVLIGCNPRSAEKANKLPDENPKVLEEKPGTLFFPEYGVYITNWPKGYRLANHGLPCEAGKVETFFAIFTPSGSIGVISFSAVSSFKGNNDELSSIKLLKREEFYGKVDLYLQTIGKNKIDITLNAIEQPYENFFLQNITTVPPADTSDIINVLPVRLPVAVPDKVQSVVIMLDFQPQKNGNEIKSAFNFWIRNNYANIGGICEIDSLISGELELSFTEDSKPLNEGDSVLIFNAGKSRKWVLANKDGFITLDDISHSRKKTKLKIPVSKEYKWEFTCQKYESMVNLEIEN